ncbi:MAG: ferritin-like domain-containing protein [Gammaproteobacteria bacterium]|jgi:bacterioferritin|nr:ferritin-like domain-containing protein [Gammaproteobacteria bacterium]
MSFTKKDLITELNKDLQLEYKSIVLYVTQIASLKGAKYQQTIEELRAHLDQEVQHAITVAQQIDFLGGKPSTTLPDFPLEDNAKEAFEADLELESRQLDRYRERVQQADDLGLPDVAEALSPVLEETQHHLRDLKSVLAA